MSDHNNLHIQKNKIKNHLHACMCIKWSYSPMYVICIYITKNNDNINNDIHFRSYE